jgi:hypothetical protein
LIDNFASTVRCQEGALAELALVYVVVDAEYSSPDLADRRGPMGGISPGAQSLKC